MINDISHNRCRSNRSKNNLPSERNIRRCPTRFGAISSCSIARLYSPLLPAISSRRGSRRSLFQQWPTGAARVRSESHVSRLLLFYGALRQNGGATRGSLRSAERPLFVLSHDTFVRQSVSICGKPDGEDRMAIWGLYWPWSNRSGQVWPSG